MMDHKNIFPDFNHRDFFTGMAAGIPAAIPVKEEKMIKQLSLQFIKMNFCFHFARSPADL